MSPALYLLSSGLHDTVQDGGRLGYRHLGIPPSGALDAIGHRLANALVGNPSQEAVLEILRLGPRMVVEAQSVRLAVVGPIRLTLTQDGSRRGLAPGRSYTLRRGDELALGAVAGASCAYLAVAGGFALSPVLGSLSTYVRAGIGPLGGRALAEGDRLPLKRDTAPSGAECELPCLPDYGAGPIRVMAGPQRERFTETAWRTLLSEAYGVGGQSDRMGLRLNGARLEHVGKADIVSDGLVAGSIQVPGDGLPIVLLADHQTVGGYAKIATVITADLPRLGRAMPGDVLHFSAVGRQEALDARHGQERMVTELVQGLVPVREGGIDLEALYGAPLVSGMVNALDPDGAEPLP